MAPALSELDLVLAASLLAINAAISVGLRLGLERSLAIAALRMLVQLSLVGFVLRLVFADGSLLVTLLVAAIMLGVATYEVVARQSPRFSGWMTYGLGGGTLVLVSGLATAFACSALIARAGELSPFEPRILLPVLGMILGNTLTGVGLALSTLIDLAQRERRSIEGRLAQGATRIGAFRGVLQQTLRTASLPIINAMSVAGLVTLPGMMTGQILAGVDPVEAAKYQIMILCVISGAAALGAMIAAVAGVGLLSDGRHRLRLDRLETSPGNRGLLP